MADLLFSSFLQGPLGEAIEAVDTMDALPPPAFEPAVAITDGGEPKPPVKGPAMRLLGPGDVAGLPDGTVVRTEPSPGAVDLEPNYMAVVEVLPPELPWLLTPARATPGGRLRPWLVLVVVEDAGTPLQPGAPLPTIDAAVAELPDLRDSWAWAHVQRTTGSGTLPGGGEASAAAVGRLVCPRRLSPGVTYRACLVPAFASGVAAARGDIHAGETHHELAWRVEAGGRVTLPVYHNWTFTTGSGGDFEALATRLGPADPDALRVSSVRLVDVRAPWAEDKPLSRDAQLVGVRGALVPFADPDPPEHAAAAEALQKLDERIRAELDAPANRVSAEHNGDKLGALSPPLYGGKHVCQPLVEGDPAWLAQLNTAVANRIAAGLGAEYVRANQEDLMAKAWEQVGAIREANRRRAVVELTTEVALKVHDRHVTALETGEAVVFAAAASARTRTAPETTLALETRMSRMVDGAGSAAFARLVRPAGKLARRTEVSVRSLIPRALAGQATVPAGAPVIPETPTVVAGATAEVAAEAAATQLVTMTALARVAALNDAAPGADALTQRIDRIGLDAGIAQAVAFGGVGEVAAALGDNLVAVTQVTQQVLSDMISPAGEFGAVSTLGVPVAHDALAGRVTDALHPGESHAARLSSQVGLPQSVSAPGAFDPVMAAPEFPLPTALALLASDPEWFMPGLGALPSNKVALLRQNGAFVESYLVGLNHEMGRELLWREYPTDQRGTPFRRFWPRVDGTPDIAPISAWMDGAALGTRLVEADELSVLLVRGDVLRRYPDMVVTAVRSTHPDADGHHRPDPGQTPVAPMFVIKVDAATNAYAFKIPNAELLTPASADNPGWFFVLAEHGFRIRFGFDEPPEPGIAFSFDGWQSATWPSSDPANDPARAAFVPVRNGHAFGGDAFGPPGGLGADAPSWNRDAADVARIALQRPFRVAIQADVLLQHRDGQP